MPLLVAASVSLAGTLLTALEVVTSPLIDPGVLLFMLVFLVASLVGVLAAAALAWLITRRT